MSAIALVLGFVGMMCYAVAYICALDKVLSLIPDPDAGKIGLACVAVGFCMCSISIWIV